MQVKTAIIQFLSDEFHLDPEGLNPDTAFEADLGLSSQQLADLLQRLQDSLNIILPEDKLDSLTTISNLLELIESPSLEENEPPLWSSPHS